MPADAAEEVVLLSWQAGKAPRLDDRSVWHVMQYEGLLGQLQGAIDQSDTLEAQKLWKDSHAVCSQLQGHSGAEALLESGQYDNAGRKRVRDMFMERFSQPNAKDTPQNHGADDLMLYDPFHNTAQDLRPAVFQDAAEALPDTLPKVSTPLQPVTTKVLDSLMDAVDNKDLCKKTTTAVAGARPLKKPLQKHVPPKSHTVLQLRGGGAFDDCGGYGSCDTSLCGSFRPPTKTKEKKKKTSPRKAHERVKHSLASSVNAFLDDPPVALTLVVIDLFSDLMGMVSSWPWWYWIGFVALSLVTLQQLLEIYLHSSLVKKEVMDDDTVCAVVTFWADDGMGDPIRIERGSIGYVDEMGDADWRVDTGAFVTFEGMDHCVFISETDFEDLEVTSGLYEYFSNPMNVFNCCLLAVVWAFEVPPLLEAGGGAGALLLVLRLLKPTLRMYGRKNKMDEMHEHHERVHGHAGHEHGGHEHGDTRHEGHGEHVPDTAQVVGTGDMHKILGVAV